MKRIPGRSFVAAMVLALLGIACAPLTLAAEATAWVKEGKAIAFDRRKGNCLACHPMDNGESPGNIGPPLLAMKARYPDRAKLKIQIGDPEIFNPDTSMPPFGKHHILSPEELEKVVDYVWGL